VNAELPRVLVAEDDKVSRLKLQRFLEKEMGLTVLLAADGEEAWQAFLAHDVRFVLSDWMMPGCDGPELCRRIRAVTDRPYTYFILLTGRTEQEDLLEGMASGADDYVRKPFDPAELASRMRAGFRVVHLEQALASRNTELEHTLAQLRKAVDAAGRTQLGMLPDPVRLARAEAEHGVRLAYRYQSCESLGGDVFGLELLPGDGAALFIGDVSGHGIAASLAAVRLHTFLSTNARSNPDPLHVIGQANDFCIAELPREVFATLAYMLIEPTLRRIQAVLAGHPAIILVGSGGKVNQISASIPPLGMFPDAPKSADVAALDLAPGERLIAYTDGITETRNAGGEMFAIEHLLKAAQGAARASLEDVPALLLAEADNWRAADSAPEDDVTIAALEIP
jgi:sigma-B regulation protein RsbU (phosphoserine phosphatase)